MRVGFCLTGKIQRYRNTRPGGSLCVLAVDSFSRSLSPESYVEAPGGDGGVDDQESRERGCPSMGEVSWT
jgi:hypothetical protein